MNRLAIVFCILKFITITISCKILKLFVTTYSLTVTILHRKAYNYVGRNLVNADRT